MAEQRTRSKTQKTAPSRRWEDVLLAARLADMEEGHYRNTLAIASLIELLTAKGILRPGELSAKSAELDREAEAALRPTRKAPLPPASEPAR